jgi:hypothetical protein
MYRLVPSDAQICNLKQIRYGTRYGLGYDFETKRVDQPNTVWENCDIIKRRNLSQYVDDRFGCG